VLPIGIGGNTLPGYYLESSLRFRSSATAYLSRTPTTAGNRKTWTWSGWVKRGKITAGQWLFGAGPVGTDFELIRFGSGGAANDYLEYVRVVGGAVNAQKVSNQVFRDTSAWYHIVVVEDAANTVARIYVNGSEISYSTNTNPTNVNGAINNTVPHEIGRYVGSAAAQFDGYMTEVNFVDGQALTPSDFGEYDTTTGVWKPKEYTGTYGTNGFYLPFKETQQATGFNTVLYTGTGATQSISNVGFSPDLVWLKSRSSGTDNHFVTDSVRGATKTIYTNLTLAEGSVANGLTSFNSNGFTIGTQNQINTNGNNFVAWCWDAGSSTVSNTDGTITSSVRANPATGFSVVTYTGTGAVGTVGHGLGIAPSMVIVKNRDVASDWRVWHSGLSGSNYYVSLNLTDAEATSNGLFGTHTSSIISLQSGTTVNGSGNGMVAYCFAEVAGYSKFGSYTGNGSTSGPTVTTGFRPAFVLIKRTDVADNWHIVDNTRSPDGTFNDVLRANLSNAESANNTGFNITYNDTGFTLANTNSELNASGGTYIYMAFADTRDAQFNFDASGNKNNWTANNINSNASSETTYDIMNDVATLTDEDTANFATLNPLSETSNLTTSNGNLTVANSTTETQHRLIRGTMGMSTGKYYWEVNVNNSAQVDMVGIINSSYNGTDNATVNASNGFGYGYSTSNGNWYTGGGWTSDGTTPSAFPSSGIIGVAFDADNGKLYFSRNNTWINSANPSAGTGANATYTGSETEFLPAISIYYNTGAWNINFGQFPFAYTPPTGYKKLNTYNLPDSTIKDGSQYFDVVTRAGNSSSFSVTGLQFSPDFFWTKCRNTALSHYLADTVRGDDNILFSNLTNAEVSEPQYITAISSDGYTLGAGTNVASYNGTGGTYVDWLWRGSDSSPVSNTDGTITSTVSANTDAGFSIVTYTGTAAVATVGHGLGVAPSMIITKNRDTTTEWWVYHAALGNTKYIVLNTYFTAVTSSTAWNNTSPTSTVFTLGGAGNPSNANQDVAYCFSEVEGFSKFGSYTGNGSTDGPFIYTGFRPAFILTKNVDGSNAHWIIYDTTRNTYNIGNNFLYPSLNSAESTTYEAIDHLSNGFKVRFAGGSAINNSGVNFIYAAFAENPFKHSLAR